MQIHNTLPTMNSNRVQRVSQSETSVLVNAQLRSPYCFPEHEGLTGVLLTLNGNVRYTIDQQTWRLQSRYGFLLNQGSSIGFEIEPGRVPTHVCLIFFHRELMKNVLSALTHPNELQDPTRPESLEFVQRRYTYGELAPQALLNWAEREKPNQRDGEEQAYFFFERLVRANRHHQRHRQQLPVVKASTQKALYARLYEARHLIDEQYAQPLTLETIAQQVGLNAFHLLRRFADLFHQTPHQYLTQVRLRQARHLLLATGFSVAEVSFLVGFESLGSFCGLFKRHFSCSPAQFRKRYRR
ncbi:helix-turn-helix domain-containing protein [Larkinella sp. VNQ87]|uniref:helix-turn-helix domain-containing protein n=1 Tax=Larkinella sp. VNQ87 TaxID=3400921 RepID=UPI003C11C584